MPYARINEINGLGIYLKFEAARVRGTLPIFEAQLHNPEARPCFTKILGF
jgi:hypothetical protein